MAKNLRALVRVHHCPKRQIDGRVKVFEKGSVFAAAELGAEDIKHLLRAKHIEETDDVVGPAPAPVVEDGPTQAELVQSLDEDLKAEQGAA